MKLDEVEYWTRRAAKEIELSKQCSGLASAAHCARAATFKDMAHDALRSRQPSPPGGQAEQPIRT
jgi:hypothetical protein